MLKAVFRYNKFTYVLICSKKKGIKELLRLQFTKWMRIFLTCVLFNGSKLIQECISIMFSLLRVLHQFFLISSPFLLQARLG